MKTIILGIILIALVLLVGHLTHYQQRMQEYNKHICAVNGYQADCITPLE